MIVKVGRTKGTKLQVISISTILISMTFFTSTICTENEGAFVGEEFQVNTYTTGYQAIPSIAMDANGNFVIVWGSEWQDESYGGIFAQRYDSNGNPQGNEFQVNTNTTNTQWLPSVAMNTSGDFVIAWQSDGQDGDLDGIFAQRYDGNGNPVGNEFQVNTYTIHDQQVSSIAMDSTGNFVIAWHGEGTSDAMGIYARRYNASGDPQGTQFQVNTETIGNQVLPAITMDPLGNFVITWTSYGQDGDGYGIYAQRYDSDGNPLGSEFKVNTYVIGDQLVPSVAMNSTGDFVITWYGEGSGNYGIYAQRYNNSGIPQGTQFQVNTNTTTAQFVPSIAMDPVGNFAITWVSYLQDGDDEGIFAQQFDKNGNPSGTEFQVNTYVTDVQDWPSIAMDSVGNYVITWESYGQDGDKEGIFAQRFNMSFLLELSNIQVQYITDTSATITWETNIPANSTVEYGFTKLYGLVAKKGSNVRLHDIDLKNLEPGRLYHFRVSSYQNLSNYIISSDLTFTTKFPIELEPGWNMISVPLNQTDSDLGNVLENISGDFDTVYWYDVTDSIDHWELNHTGKPQSMNDLTEIYRFKGLWIHITNPLGTTFYIIGTAPEIGYVNQITLYNGWNFVGYPSLIERVPSASGLPLGVDMVQWYNASSGLWESWDPGSYSPDNLNLLRPGQGLWIHYTGATDVWSLEYVN